MSEPLARLGEVATVRTNTKRCQACGALFNVAGAGATRRLTCDVCRTGPQCSTCYGRGGLHAPSCRAGICHGCGERTAIGTKFYCAACRARKCPECHRLSGTHHPRCQYERRERRTDWLREYRGIVTVEDIERVYLENRARAVATARRICGPLYAEDVVHDVAVYLLAQREYLRVVPGPAYFLRAVKNGALLQLQSAWRRRVVAMDLDVLLIAEAMTHPVRRQVSEATVRLPVEAG